MIPGVSLLLRPQRALSEGGINDDLPSESFTWCFGPALAVFYLSPSDLIHAAKYVRFRSPA